MILFPPPSSPSVRMFFKFFLDIFGRTFTVFWATALLIVKLRPTKPNVAHQLCKIATCLRCMPRPVKNGDFQAHGRPQFFIDLKTSLPYLRCLEVCFFFKSPVNNELVATQLSKLNFKLNHPPHHTKQQSLTRDNKLWTLHKQKSHPVHGNGLKTCLYSSISPCFLKNCRDDASRASLPGEFHSWGATVDSSLTWHLLVKHLEHVLPWRPQWAAAGGLRSPQRVPA